MQELFSVENIEKHEISIPVGCRVFGHEKMP